MSLEDTALIFGMVVGILLGSILGAVTVSRCQPNYKQQAIEHGYAEYNKTTGAWQWIEKAEKQDED